MKFLSLRPANVSSNHNVTLHARSLGPPWLRIKWTIAEHNLKHAWWTKDLQKVVRWFLDADDNADSHRNLIIIFWPIYNVPLSLHANSFSGISTKSTNLQAKSMRKQLISFAQVIKFLWNVKLKGDLTASPPLRTPLCAAQFRFLL